MTTKHYVGIYVRVSTQEQAREGHSVQEQENRLRAFCEAKDWNIVRVYVDGGFTGSNMNRPELNRMLKDIERGKIKTVLVYKLDRLSRSQKDTLHLIEEVFLKKGIDFVSMNENLDTSTPYGRAMIGILSAFAQLEREQIKERMMMGRIGRAKEGHYHGGAHSPVGYHYVEDELIPDEYEFMIIRKIYKMYVEEHKTIKAIVRELNEAGLFLEGGKRWYEMAVRRCLFNPLYKGDIVFQDQVYKGQHKPVYTEEQFEKIMKEKKVRDLSLAPHQANAFKHTSLLGGLLFCGKCGARYFTKQTTGSTSKYHYQYYTCYTRGGGHPHMSKGEKCDNKHYRVEKLNEAILSEIKKLSFDHALVDDMIGTPDTHDALNEIAETQKKLDSIDDQISKLTDLFSMSVISLDVLKDKVAALTEQKTKLEETIDKLESEYEPPTMTRDEAVDLVDLIASKIEKASVDELRPMLCALIQKIMIYEDEIKIYWKFV